MKKTLVTLLVLGVAFTFSFGFCNVAFAEEEAPAAVNGPILIMPASEDVAAAVSTELDQIKKDLKETKLTVKSRLVEKSNGKPCIELTFGVDGNIQLDGIEVFRSLKKNKGYGTKPIYTTSNSTYNNTKVTVGKEYFYKVRGFILYNGVKYYTDYSNKAHRVVKKNVSAKAVTPKPLYQEPSLDGGFTPAEDKTITTELKTMFDKAFEKLDGVRYDPIELVATQVVAGTNYKFLCNSKLIYPGSVTVQKYVTIYKDLQGNCSVLKIEDVQ